MAISEYEYEAEQLARKHLPALQLLLDDGMPAERAAEFIVTCALHSDLDTMKAAQHLVELRKVFRNQRGSDEVHDSRGSASDVRSGQQ